MPWRPERTCACSRRHVDHLAITAIVPKSQNHPTTPDGRYFVVKGRLWRATNPALDEADRQFWVNQLMRARRDVGAAMRADHRQAEKSARAAVDEAKRALGERGPVWWTDGSPDLNRKLVANTPYEAWHRQVLEAVQVKT